MSLFSLLIVLIAIAVPFCLLGFGLRKLGRNRRLGILLIALAVMANAAEAGLLVYRCRALAAMT